ncbi:hypothetical protein ACQUJT_11580 [Ralstonia pseudosolanacearum]|uniref:hypothetical protein n=1 Tax=Ralstonia pseudosolanacearum TaxID=1310165 RepID=UPI0018D16D03|nr:hypothetical protein [Ralstonia pseudosolanacearum]
MKYIRWFSLAAWFLGIGVHLWMFTSEPTHSAEWYAARKDYRFIVFVLVYLPLWIAALCIVAAVGYWIRRSRLAVKLQYVVSEVHPN